MSVSPDNFRWICYTKLSYEESISYFYTTISENDFENEAPKVS